MGIEAHQVLGVLCWYSKTGPACNGKLVGYNHVHRISLHKSPEMWHQYAISIVTLKEAV